MINHLIDKKKELFIGFKRLSMNFTHEIKTVVFNGGSNVAVAQHRHHIVLFWLTNK